MWSRKRVLKKDRKQHTKKRLLFISLLSGGTGMLLIAIGVLLVMQEPAFVSPLPFFKAFGLSAENDAGTKQIKEFLKSNAISYKEVVNPGKTLYQITMSDGGIIYLTSDKSLSEQLSSLQRILSRLTMEGKKFARLDLRYDKPVIVLQ